jgi:HD-GYP domain-containing protein (c-di-GMP phosphodiesterase class II)
MEMGKALQIIREASGSQLCPDCVSVFLKLAPWDEASTAEKGDLVTGSSSDNPAIEAPKSLVIPVIK